MKNKEIRRTLMDLERKYKSESAHFGLPVLDLRSMSDAEIDVVHTNLQDRLASIQAGRPAQAARSEPWERILGQLRDRPLPPFTGSDHWLGTRLDAPPEWWKGMPQGIWWGR